MSLTGPYIFKYKYEIKENEESYKQRASIHCSKVGTVVAKFPRVSSCRSDWISSWTEPKHAHSWISFGAFRRWGGWGSVLVSICEIRKHVLKKRFSLDIEFNSTMFTVDVYVFILIHISLNVSPSSSCHKSLYKSINPYNSPHLSRLL